MSKILSIEGTRIGTGNSTEYQCVISLSDKSEITDWLTTSDFKSKAEKALLAEYQKQTIEDSYIRGARRRKSPRKSVRSRTKTPSPSRRSKKQITRASKASESENESAQESGEKEKMVQKSVLDEQTYKSIPFPDSFWVKFGICYFGLSLVSFTLSFLPFQEVNLGNLTSILPISIAAVVLHRKGGSEAMINFAILGSLEILKILKLLEENSKILELSQFSQEILDASEIMTLLWVLMNYGLLENVPRMGELITFLVGSVVVKFMELKSIQVVLLLLCIDLNLQSILNVFYSKKGIEKSLFVFIACVITGFFISVRVLGERFEDMKYIEKEKVFDIGEYQLKVIPFELFEHILEWIYTALVLYIGKDKISI
eukprot:maker-scaffold_61-snap-gene-0.13-mRNA-1 protein AED:0.00 eAED:0.00 QI:151/1/1/1/0.5/0.33/3/79/370